MRYEGIDRESNYSEVNLRSHYQPMKEPIPYKVPQSNIIREANVSPRSHFYPMPDHSNNVNIKPKESVGKTINLSNVPRHPNVCNTNRTGNYVYSNQNITQRNQSKDQKKNRTDFTCL
jgi:hypothetical protein